jgi:hypothetical protein
MHLGRHATVLATVALILAGCSNDGQDCHDLYDAQWAEHHGMDLHCPGHNVAATPVAQHDVDGDKKDDAFVRLRCTTRGLGDRFEVFQGGTACGNPKMLTVMVYEDESAVLDGNLLVKSDGVYTFGWVGQTKEVWKLVQDGNRLVVSKPPVAEVIQL